MRYSVHRVGPGSVARLAFLIGVGLSLVPGLCMGCLVIQAARRLAATFAGMRTVTVELPPVDLGLTKLEVPSFQVDLVNQAGLAGAAQAVQGVLDNAGATMLWIALAISVIGALALGLAAVVAALLYNVLAGAFGGIEVELQAK
jgi:hypothetical protein